MQWETELDPARLEAAVGLARHATRESPQRVGTWLALSHALAKLGNADEALACVREGLRVLPNAGELHLRLAELLLVEDQWEVALPHAARATALAPDDLKARRTELELLAMLGRQDMLELSQVAAFSAASEHLLRLQARRGGPAGALEACEALLAAAPGHTNATYLKALALARLSCAEAARRLISIDRLVEIQALPSPQDYAGPGAFRDAVASEIRDNPTLTCDPRGKATQDGLVTRVLRQPGAAATETLLGQFRRAVDDYVERLVTAGDDFASHRPQRARLEAWGMIYGGEGRQAPHIHAAGWLSGVYYVAAPRDAAGDGFRGPLIVGATEQIGADPPWGLREIEPAPGTLVLFPSYVPHATAPSGVDGARISVAFDVVDATNPIL